MLFDLVWNIGPCCSWICLWLILSNLQYQEAFVSPWVCDTWLLPCTGALPQETASIELCHWNCELSFLGWGSSHREGSLTTCHGQGSFYWMAGWSVCMFASLKMAFEFVWIFWPISQVCFFVLPSLKILSKNTKTIWSVTGFDNTGSVVALVKTTGRHACNITEKLVLQMFFSGRFSEMPAECIDEYTVGCHLQYLELRVLLPVVLWVQLFHQTPYWLDGEPDMEIYWCDAFYSCALFMIKPFIPFCFQALILYLRVLC